jgi:hypothetical protein
MVPQPSLSTADALALPPQIFHDGCAEPSDASPAVELQRSSARVLTAVLEEAFRTGGSENGALQAPSSKGPRWTPNIRALAVSGFLFAFVTAAQFFASNVAQSRALRMDCISSTVDVFTYFGNIFVECRKRDGAKHEVSQLVIVSVSLGLLTFFTVIAMVGSVNIVSQCQAPIAAKGEFPMEEGDDDVNGWITLSFALANIVFDIVCMAMFYKSSKSSATGRSVNMFSALLHVGADFLRASSTLIMSIIILCTDFDSTCLDAYTSVLIGATILGGAALGFVKWAKMLVTYLRKDEEVAEKCNDAAGLGPDVPVSVAV